jgi:hypothetical protein
MPLEVIGAGFGRTGTTTLKWALETLLGGKCHHMQEVFANPKQVAGWAARARGETIDWEKLLEGYVAACDWPAAAYWAELAERYPNAKVVLTRRDFDKWYDSANETIYSLYRLTKRPPTSWLFHVNPRMPEFSQMVADTIWGERGVFGERFHDREHVRGIYERHTEEVKRTIPAERLLVWAPSDGWEPLCRILGVPVPSEPMQHRNERQEMIGMRRKLTAIGWVTSPLTAPASLVMRALGR